MLGILCGFAAEEKIAQKLSPLVAMSGAREARARAQAQWLVAEGATALLSFGVAGGLANNLTPQDIIIGDKVADKNGQTWQAEPHLVAKFKQAAPHAHIGTVFGSAVIIETPEHKNKLCADTGALIVDMESHLIAEIAHKHGLPFAVLRGISDDASAPLPPAVLCGINEDGTENIPAVLISLAKNIQQLPSLLHFAGNTGKALRQLNRIIEKLNH